MRALALLAELGVVLLAWVAVRRLVGGAWRERLAFAIKAYLTLRVIGLIAFHEVQGVTIYQVIRERIGDLDLAAFVGFTLAATAIKLLGIASSIARWALMLAGQGIRLPARHVAGAFFIGRFLGTFLPSTLGLDGYKLYDAARFSGRTIEVTAATAVEKILGLSGIFGTFLIALPLGVSIFGERAAFVTALGVPIALLPLAMVAIGFFWPGPAVIRFALERLPLPTMRSALARVADGATAYSARKGLLLAAWALSLVQHFSTAAMYYFCARALGVEPHDATFWQVTFASSIQIFATVISPFTIAGEGIREAAQGLLLQNQMTFAVAAASGLLGFLAAEAPTLLGAIPWLTRGEHYRPAWGTVDGEPIDFEAARHAATDLGAERVAMDGGAVDVEPLRERVVRGALLGLAAGAAAGAIAGLGEALYLLYRGKLVLDAQALWSAPLAIALPFGAAGAAGGALVALLPFPRELRERWIPALAFTGALVPWAAIATLFFAFRDAFGERLPPPGVIASIAAGYAVMAALLIVLVPRLGRAARPLPLAALAAATIATGAVLAAARAPAPPVPAPPRPIAEPLRARPNVILVIVDTLRADALPAYGGNEIHTPALDRLASGGTVFEAAFAQASWTKPSIATILSGLYPSSHGATLKPSQLPDSVETLAEAMRAHGYRTGGIVTNVNLAPSFNFQQGFEDYHYLEPDYLFGAADSSSRLLAYEIGRRAAAALGRRVRPGDAYQPAERVNARAFEWLDLRQDERFFLLLHYMEPHDPYFTHPDDGRAIARSSTPRPDPSLRDEMWRRYLGEIEYFDTRFGELLAELERRGLYDDTLIVLTADHGEEFHDHGGWWHGLTLYDEQIAVPLLAKWPANARPAPARWPAQVRLVDLAPTLLGAAGAAAPPGVQGENLLASPGEPPRERTVFAEEDHEGNVLQALRAGGWKLIRANAGNPRGLAETELYQVAVDPRERSDRANDEAVRARILLSELDESAAQAKSRAHATQQVKIERAECERLRALGYVEECEP
jgi:arylsulfatase A-like enzyme/uncharacterized membrane protein YbhN (UPF0104 family)